MGSGVQPNLAAGVRAAERFSDLALAEGFMHRLKVEGWRLFCERLGVAPFATWEELPGFDSIQDALRTAEVAAFAPEGMLCFLNRLRPEGADALTEVPFTPEGMADELEKAFRERVARWGGSTAPPCAR